MRYLVVFIKFWSKFWVVVTLLFYLRLLYCITIYYLICNSTKKRLDTNLSVKPFVGQKGSYI